MNSPSISDLLQAATKQLADNLADQHHLADQHRLADQHHRLDAELLLCLVLNKPREYLYTWPEKQITPQQQTEYLALIKKRSTGIPLAYLTGEKEFWSHTFNVTTDTLIPRPDTELIVEHCLIKLKDNPGPFLDLGTGSGVIAICVAKELPSVEVLATDNSEAALAVASSNATTIGASVNFLYSDWFENIPPQSFSVIAANPPYIAADDPHLQRGGLQHEPISALRSCEDGFADITAIILKASTYLRDCGWLILEHGHTQGTRTRSLMQENNFAKIKTIKDLAQNDRVTLGQKV